jgi:serine/threonine protein kinase
MIGRKRGHFEVVAKLGERAGAIALVLELVEGANVKLRPDGAVRVLDFGLAKVSRGPAGSDTTPHLSAMTSPMATPVGVVLGPAAYMSPEQANGQVAFSADFDGHELGGRSIG